jgi:polysaccharide pyruvyl transferase WcaK-like protein
MGLQYDECNITDEPVSSVTNILDEIAATDMVVATRYHNIVLALMLFKPVLSLSYERKNDSLMAELGLSEYCQRIDRLDVGKLCEQFVQLEKNADAVKTQIEGKTRAYRKALAEQYRILFAPERLSARSALYSTRCP